MATIFDRYKDRVDKQIEEDTGGGAKKAAPLPPYGSMTLGGKAKPEDPEAAEAKAKAKLRLLRSTGRTP